MYSSYSIWLIITSIILLLAMVGAIVITIKQPEGPKASEFNSANLHGDDNNVNLHLKSSLLNIPSFNFFMPGFSNFKFRLSAENLN